MQLIVLSAGRGSRLPKKFRNRPKCLLEINSTPLLLHNSVFFKKFKNKIIISGYKSQHLKKIVKSLEFKNITNNKYAFTNMVYSLFLAKKFIKQDIVVVYGDIIVHEDIFEILKPKKNILPVNVNWLNNWKNRMSFSKVVNDAENLITKNNKLIEIGSKIDKNNLPKYQFMGILKLKKDSFFRCYNFFKKLNNKKIDMTSFLNLCIKKNIISLEVKKYKNYWYEVDTSSDHSFTEKDIKQW
ncbi:NTP transferase domain-containing protein [Candidatus Pelagibacter sp. HIMB1623]|uniref:phosphocholine cytidylyltransferase family protein n=1 Tax=Candidatus Pelagibacter sp. HIMB1623 TaxID=3413358 RepID=UPI003F836303